MVTNDTMQETIAKFGRKYIWWKPVGNQPHSEDRIIAQTMNLGTYDDILLLERTVGEFRAAAPSSGGAGFVRGSDPVRTRDGALPATSLDDLMATKLKATLDRAEEGLSRYRRADFRGRFPAGWGECLPRNVPR